MKTPPAGREHVTIAVSGAYGGRTVDFRKFAQRGMTLLGMTQRFENGCLTIAGDLAHNIAEGDANHLGLLAEADAYVEANGLDLPPEEDAKIIAPDPDCLITPVRLIWKHLGLKRLSGRQVMCKISIGSRLMLLMIAASLFMIAVCRNPDGIYFLGLPWLSMRGSSFIWGVWEDAKYLASHIAEARPSDVA